MASPAYIWSASLTPPSEARDRVRAAILNSGEDWPNRHTTVSLSPASLPKRGSGFDLAIAVSIMAATQAIPATACAGLVLIGELGLDGRVRPVPGVLPAVLSAADAGRTTVVVAQANAEEAALVPGVTVIGIATLRALMCRLRGEPPPFDEDEDPAPPRRDSPPGTQRRCPTPDLADVRGQPLGRRGLEISAAGGHHLWLAGPPGCGKTMLAERLPTLLPSLDREAALEVTAIHSVAGTLPPGAPLIDRPPFYAPHHSASRPAIVGGGTGRLIRPGAVSLAHHGVLFMDEAPEFASGVLDALRQPLEDGTISVDRTGLSTRFPASFTLVMAANPCPCAAARRRDCRCAPAIRNRYLSKVTGPIMDRIDVKLSLEPATRAELRYDLDVAESSQAVAARVLEARERALKRMADTPWRSNSDVPGPELRRRYPPPPEAMWPVDNAMFDGSLSARGLDRVLRVAWTIADLANRDTPAANDISEALALWKGTTDDTTPR